MEAGGAEPGNRAPAPEPRLRAVQEFINTADLEAGVDQLGSVEAAGVWLENHGYRPLRRLNAADHGRLLQFREAIRAMVAANNGPPLGNDRARINEILSSVALYATVGSDGQIRVRGRGALDGFVAELVETVVRATANGTWLRLKACHRDVCRWAFWDASRSRSGKWCTMKLCGSREKMRCYRSRKKER